MAYLSLLNMLISSNGYENSSEDTLGFLIILALFSLYVYSVVRNKKEKSSSDEDGHYKSTSKTYYKNSTTYSSTTYSSKPEVEIPVIGVKDAVQCPRKLWYIVNKYPHELAIGSRYRRYHRGMKYGEKGENLAEWLIGGYLRKHELVEKKFKYRWTGRKFIVRGYIDFYDPINNIVYEIKTLSRRNIDSYEFWKEVGRRQAAVYGKYKNADRSFLITFYRKRNGELGQEREEININYVYGIVWPNIIASIRDSIPYPDPLSPEECKICPYSGYCYTYINEAYEDYDNAANTDYEVIE